MSVQASAVTLIAARYDDSIELYFQLPSQDLEKVFKKIPEGLLDQEGYVDLHRLQKDTVTPSNLLLKHMGVSSSGGPAVLEGMSFMTHPSNTVLPFETPWDAITTTTFCSADPNGPKMTLEQMTTYSSAYTDELPHIGAISLTLPVTEPTEIFVREFVDGREVSVYTTEMTIDGRITLFSYQESTSFVGNFLRRFGLQ
ncbi:MAG: hypothetical protein AAF198_10660 [Pseudomonadota bacterium]